MRFINWLIWVFIFYVSMVRAELVAFKMPQLQYFEIEDISIGLNTLGNGQWIQARLLGSSSPPFLFGSRIVLLVKEGVSIDEILGGMNVSITRVLAKNLYIVETTDPYTAISIAAYLSQKEEVIEAHPIRIRKMKLLSSYAPAPNDPLFFWAWHLENRDSFTGMRNGFDLNLRTAWTLSKGEGTLIAVVDDGVELIHPDLSSNASPFGHYNFFASIADGMPKDPSQIHGTAVAGIMAAVQNNEIGACGIAPMAKFCSWIVFDAFGNFIDEEKAGDMYTYLLDSLWIQNHSWGVLGVELYPLSSPEDLGIQKAVTKGRGGKGIIIVRAAGNERNELRNTNDDGYAQDPRVITVGAVRSNGQPTTYSTPGATVLVAGFGGDWSVDLPDGTTTNFPAIFTTDRIGTLGYNKYGNFPDFAYGTTGFSGTSASAPQISGICSLILAANPALTYRDVQQILILSSRHLYLQDPDIKTNGAGLLVSHNAGFGVPDAGEAVRMASVWKPRPTPTSLTLTTRVPKTIPDDGLRVVITGTNVPSDLASIPAWPIDGPPIMEELPEVELVDIGLATSPISSDVKGKAVLIQRGINYFSQKLLYAVQAGAVFAIIYNNQGTTERIFAIGAEIHLVPLPAVFIDQSKGSALANLLRQNPKIKVSIKPQKIIYQFEVKTNLLCEHVAVRVQTTHNRRADLTIALVSPSGTRSVLQRFNNDLSSALVDWTYYSVHHFFESSYGIWTIEFLDQRAGVTGSVRRVDLTIYGVPIQDLDHDGLDDEWEIKCLGDLSYGPKDDPDGDGYSNIREYLLGTDPLISDQPFKIYTTWWNNSRLRLSWPSKLGVKYRLWSLNDGFNLINKKVMNAEIMGDAFETDVIVPIGPEHIMLYWIEEVKELELK